MTFEIRLIVSRILTSSFKYRL